MALSVYYLIAPAECSANLSRFDGVRYGIREEASTSYEMMNKTRSVGFGEEVKKRILLGTYALSAGYFDEYYGRALKVRSKIITDFKTAFDKVDFILSPTTPTPHLVLVKKQRIHLRCICLIYVQFQPILLAYQP